MPWKYRSVQLEDDKGVADSGTLTVDLDLTDPVTALIVRFKAANDSAQVPDFQPEEAITSIEIVDGGQVYWSLPGPQAVAAATYGLGRWPRCFYDERANNNQRIDTTLMFGRFLGDEEYSFHPKALINPQLKVSWADTALFLNDSLTIGVTAQVCEGLEPSAEMLAWKQVESWATLGSGDHKTELPVDRVIRALLMRPYLTTVLWTQIWTNFKLDCDLGKFIPFNLHYHEFGDILRQQFGPYHVGLHGVLTNAEVTALPMGEVIKANGTVVGQPSFCNLYTAGAWGSMIPYIAGHDGGALSDQPVEYEITGHYPWRCLLWPFGRWMDPETWFDPSEYAKVDLKLTEAYAAAAGSVAVQQIVPVP